MSSERRLEHELEDLIALQALKIIQHDTSKAVLRSVGVGLCGAMNIVLTDMQAHETGPRRRAVDTMLCVGGGWVLREAFRTWPRFSGDLTYPIPGVSMTQDVFSAYSMFTLACTELGWSPDHPYGAMRLDLLQHCIDWFAARLQAAAEMEANQHDE